MTEITTVGLDLAKNVFHVVGFDGRGVEVRKKALRRGQVARYFAQLPRCVVAMEACGGAHFWGRTLEGLGHEVRLVPPQHVKAYVQGNKNDYNDARAMVEAMKRPGMRFVAVKTVAQQDRQAVYRLRQGCQGDETALCNRIRSLVGERGLVAPKGKAALGRAVPEWLADAENGLSEDFRRLLAQEYRRWQELAAHLREYDRALVRQGREDPDCRRLQTIPGYGPVVASVFQSVVGRGEAYRRGRDVSAALGLVPRQHTTGGKAVLGGISKRGDAYLRSLLVHGARAVVSRAKHKDDPLSRWINRIRAERGFNKATVALANKMARMGWVVLRHQTEYRPWGQDVRVDPASSGRPA